MGYPYGTQGAPAVGSGAPGLPQRSSAVGADPSGPPLQVIVIRPNSFYANNPFPTPDWATNCRVTTLGKGGRARGGTSGLSVGSTGPHGGGGAGLAATLIEPTPPGTPVSITFDTNATLASFLNYQLSGGNGGDATTTAGGAPGLGSGGAINFNGAAGETVTATGSAAGGGGAAGRGGNGASGVVPGSGGDSGLGDAYATGGGAGGAGANGTGSINYGGISRASSSMLGAAIIGASTLISRTTVAVNCDGGDGGGGSGGTSITTISNVPGNGLVLIELW